HNPLRGRLTRNLIYSTKPVGLGAVCFTLFSIVSILEAGSAKK
ncbi:DUF2776 family protein, partial [Escherichia coli]|nr:DUF2776 family protein [Escherichia coli]